MQSVQAQKYILCALHTVHCTYTLFTQCADAGLLAGVQQDHTQHILAAKATLMQVQHPYWYSQLKIFQFWRFALQVNTMSKESLRIPTRVRQWCNWNCISTLAIWLAYEGLVRSRTNHIEDTFQIKDKRWKLEMWVKNIARSVLPPDLQIHTHEMV